MTLALKMIKGYPDSLLIEFTFIIMAELEPHNNIMSTSHYDQGWIQKIYNIIIHNVV